MSRLNDIGQQEFYVCFLGARDKPSAYGFFSSRGFRHILLLTPISDNQVLVIDPLVHAILHNVKNHSIDVILRKVKSIAGSKIIKYNRPISRKKKWRFRGLYNCVTLTKAVLNIWCWSITPKQLYKYLLRQGCTIIKG